LGKPQQTGSECCLTLAERIFKLTDHLLAHGARPDIADASGRIPLDILNGPPGRRAATNADASGLAPLNLAEIRGMLQEAAQKK
jgi:hypothetical protein